MNGEKEQVSTFFKTKSGNGYKYLGTLYEFPMNHQINPNMWEGMATGTYSRSFYIPKDLYDTLKAEGIYDEKS